MNRDTMKLTFKIYKEGHLKKLMRAVQKLQYPTQGRSFIMIQYLFFVELRMLMDYLFEEVALVK